MNNPYITAFLAVTSLSFSSPLIDQSFLTNTYTSTARRNVTGYKSDRKNCDLCVNLPIKKKTTKV